MVDVSTSVNCVFSIARINARRAGGLALGLMLASGASAQVSIGVDVIVGELPDITNYTPTAAEAGFDAFAIGTTSCNKGNAELLWFTGGNDNRHPVIGQNLFRLQNGRFEQIGQAWLKHGFVALQGTVCIGSQNFPHTGCTPASSGAWLGVGCSDPYNSGLNGGQSGLGPKWQVNAATGIAPYPWQGSPGAAPTNGRLRARTADLSPPSTNGPRYFVEGHYIAADDRAAGNNANNASYREVRFATVAANGTTPAHTNMSFVSGTTTVREKPAVYAWAAIDPSVQISTADVFNDGRFILASRVSGPVAGLYTYEYYLQNLDSDRCAGSFSVPKPSGASVSSIGFRDVEYHSGEPNAGDPTSPAADDWTSSTSSTNVTWAGPNFAGTVANYTLDPTVPFKLLVNGQGLQWAPGTGNNHTANVLRWGTGFNFRFTSATAPAAGLVQIGLWRPGTPTSISMIAPTPGGATTGTPSTGPCCVGQACSITTQAGCTGTFGVIGATCAGNSPCPPITGACCDTNGSCTLQTLATCLSASGLAYQGDNTVCATTTCPQPTGACCAAGGVCTVGTQAACGANVYLGNGTTCSASTCASNDLCAAAIPLCDGISTNGSNASATTDGAPASCGGGGNADIWYSYIPATSGNVVIETLAGGTASDTVLSVLSACGGTELACNDDSSGLFSRVSLNMTAGTRYVIRVASYGSSNPGTLTVRVTGGGGQGCVAVVTGSCCVGTSCSVVSEASCLGQSGSWLSGGSCTPSNRCDPSGSCCQAGNCSIVVQSACTTGGADAFTAAGTCQPNVCPPLNDDCDNRVGTPMGATPFDSTFATTDGPAHNPGCSHTDNQAFKDLWFNHPAQFSGRLRIDTCGSTFDTVVVVYDNYGCVDFNNRLMACNDDNVAACGSNSLQSSLEINVVAGTSYTIRVGGYSAAFGGPGTLTLTNVTSGACCVGTSCSVGLQSACNGTFQGAASVCATPGVPALCCRVDFNGSGGLTVNDIFDYLNAWFAGSASADFNGTGGVTVQDIFAFLNAWFTGC
jgi:hypothetical protein